MKAPYFKDIAEKYLEWAEKIKPGEGRDDKYRYENTSCLCLTDKRLNEISSFDLERLKNELLKRELLRQCEALPRLVPSDVQ